MPVEHAYRTEQDYTQRLSSYQDCGEAMAAFLDKREPSWSCYSQLAFWRAYSTTSISPPAGPGQG
jgi:hypothetical protein